MEPPSGFEHGTPGLEIQRLNHYADAVDFEQFQLMIQYNICRTNQSNSWKEKFYEKRFVETYAVLLYAVLLWRLLKNKTAYFTSFPVAISVAVNTTPEALQIRVFLHF